MIRQFVLSATFLSLAGCVSAPKTLYQWGSFQEQTYLMYSAPGKVQPQDQILKLESEIEKAKGSGAAVPPGLYAHLGLLLMNEGNLVRAGEYLELERQTYPESQVLMNRLLGKLKPNTAGVTK